MTRATTRPHTRRWRRTYGDGGFVALAGLLEGSELLVGHGVVRFRGHGVLKGLRAEWMAGAVREGGRVVVVAEVWVNSASGH